jgi:hypothetical protein
MLSNIVNDIQNIREILNGKGTLNFEHVFVN